MKKLISVMLSILIILSICGVNAYAVFAVNDMSESLNYVEESNFGSCKIFDYVDKNDFRKAGHIQRLYDNETLSSYVFKNADGTITSYILSEEVKFQDVDGNIYEKDISLKQTADGSYTTKLSNINLSLPKYITNGMAIAAGDINMTMYSGNKILSAAEYNESDNSISYHHAFGENTILKFTPTLSGVKEDIIVESYTDNNEFSFIIETKGTNLYKDESGYYLSISKDSKERIYFSDVVIYDSGNMVTVGEVSVESVKQGYMITITVPTNFLNNANIEYPVRMNSSVTITVSGSGNSKTIQDATIYSGIPTTNTGSWSYMSAGYVGTDAGYTLNIGRVFVKLPGIYNSSWYASTAANDIISVKYYVRESSAHANRTINLYANLGTGTYTNWTENGVTWNNSTATDYTTVEASANIPTSGSAYFDITSLVRKWKSGTRSAELGFTLRNPDETNIENNKGMYTSDYSTTSYRPYVVCTYSGNNVTPSITINFSSNVPTGTKVYIYRENDTGASSMKIPNGVTVSGNSVTIQQYSATWNGASETNYITIGKSYAINIVAPGKAIKVIDPFTIPSSGQYVINVTLANKNIIFSKPFSTYTAPSIMSCQNYGYRYDLNAQRDFHNGIDITKTEGTPIYSISNGSVTYHQVSYSPSQEEYVNVSSGSNQQYFIQYVHLQANTGLSAGTTVTPNTIIGNVGTTGNVKAHLHIRTEYNSESVDPNSLFD